MILDGIRAAQANPIEADLVAQMAVTLREGLRDDEERPAIYRRCSFLSTWPVHRQPASCPDSSHSARELSKRQKWTSTPFADTVDKMQGQEADAVIVSYGVADPEFALQEAEFIYGLNRLNVAITRARSKCVLCLPRPLLDASPQVLDVEQAAAGLSFMRGTR